MKAIFNRLLSTPARLAALVAIVYFLSSFFSASIREIEEQPGDKTLYYLKNYWVTLTMPRILRGDEMHYLIMAHSLAQDGDLYLSNQYTSVHKGGIEMGVYHRSRPVQKFFQHFSRDQDFTLLANHPFGLSALLAMMLWPLGGSAWMEPAAIWVTVLWGVMGVLVFTRILEVLGVSWPRTRNAALILAFATPWWSYSRTLYTEVYIGTAMLIVMLAVLKNRTLWALPFVIAMGWFKYPAVSLFFGAGAGDAMFRRWRNFFIYGIAGAAVLVCIYSFNRHFFADTSWVTRTDEPVRKGLHSIRTAAAPISYVPGQFLNNVKRLFFDFDKGLFPHCPLLLICAIGIGVLAREARRIFWLILAIAGPWGLVHITYEYLMTGASYTTRYLVPLVPMAAIGLPWFWSWSRGRMTWQVSGVVLLALSLVNNFIAGIFPALTFNQTPWEAFVRFLKIVISLTGEI